MALFMSLNSYAQKEQQTLLVGDYDAADTNEAWDGFNLQNAPIVFSYIYSGSQVMYTAEQLSAMKDKELTSLSFKCFAPDTYTEYTGTAKLYLQEVDETEFVKDANGKYNWFKYDNTKVVATTELQLDFLNAYGEPLEIVFDFSKNPFKYSGKTLVVTVENECTGELPENACFFWVPSKVGDPYRSFVYGSDNTDFQTNQAKDNILGNGNEDKWKNAPTAKFTYQESEAPVDPTPTPTDGTLTLGHFNDTEFTTPFDGFNLQNSPIIFTYYNSGSQVMYTAEQLADMKNKEITSMTFRCFTEDCYRESYTSNMKMYLQEVDNTEFSFDPVSEKYEWVKFDESNAVAEMEFTMNPLDAYMNLTPIDVTFNLTKPFVYTGKTLVVTITNESAEYIDGSDGAIRFLTVDCALEDPYRSQVFASDKITFLENQAKDNVLKPLDNEDRWKEAPAVQFAYKESTHTGICNIVKSDNNSVTTANGAVIVTLSENSPVQIMNIAGSNIMSAELSAGSHTYAVPTGIYIVRVGNNTYKVCVNK